MKRLKLWIVVALAAAFAMSMIGTATAQPSPPVLFTGTVTNEDGSAAATGLSVEAFVGDLDCTGLAGPTYEKNGATRYTVVLKTNQQEDGCSDRGAEVSFRIGNRWANETAEIAPLGLPTFHLTLGAATVDVDIRVWQLERDPLILFVSLRPEGASWRDFGTIRQAMDDGPVTTSQGHVFAIEDSTLTVTLPGGDTTNIDIRVWQLERDPSIIFVSARPEGASWRDFGTIRQAMDDGPVTTSQGHVFAIEDSTLTVPLSGGSE